MSNNEPIFSAPRSIMGLDFLWLEITPKCNLNCIHCYADSSPFNPLKSKMKFNDWTDLMYEAYAQGCRQLQFIGGEPTIHPDLAALIAEAYKVGFEFIEVYTNGVSISDELFKTFVHYKVNIAFSVYSNKKDTHDLITQRKGSYDKTIRSIKVALNLGLNVRVGIISMAENNSDVSQTINHLHSMGVGNVKVDGIRGIGRGSNIDQHSNPIHELCGACWKGKLTVDSDGNVFPCVFSRFNLIGTFYEGISNLLHKKELLSFRGEVQRLDELRSNNVRAKINCSPDEYCGPDFHCNPDSCNPCDPSACSPRDSCRPDCGPNCSPNCSPQCAPYCNPECSPYSECRPK